MNNITNNFAIRSMSYRHWLAARDAFRRTRAVDRAEMLAAARAYDCALFYHNALRLPMEAK